MALAVPRTTGPAGGHDNGRMILSSSNGQGSPPGPRELASLLGRSSSHWLRLHAELTAEFGPLGEKWSFSKKTQHWSLQLKRKKNQRTIVYMIPCQKHFVAAFALGEKACRAARESGLPAALLAVIDKAPKYPEGRGVRLEVRNKQDLESVKHFAVIKMAN
jgi:hypothetical protein